MFCFPCMIGDEANLHALLSCAPPSLRTSRSVARYSVVMLYVLLYVWRKLFQMVRTSKHERTRDTGKLFCIICEQTFSGESLIRGETKYISSAKYFSQDKPTNRFGECLL